MKKTPKRNSKTEKSEMRKMKEKCTKADVFPVLKEFSEEM